MFRFIQSLFRREPNQLLLWLEGRLKVELEKQTSAISMGQRECEIAHGGKIRAYKEVIDYVKTHSQ